MLLAIVAEILQNIALQNNGQTELL